MIGQRRRFLANLQKKIKPIAVNWMWFFFLLFFLANGCILFRWKICNKSAKSFNAPKKYKAIQLKMRFMPTRLHRLCRLFEPKIRGTPKSKTWLEHTKQKKIQSKKLSQPKENEWTKKKKNMSLITLDTSTTYAGDMIWANFNFRDSRFWCLFGFACRTKFSR